MVRNEYGQADGRSNSNRNSQSSLKFVKHGSLSQLQQQSSKKSIGISVTPQFNELVGSRRDSPNYHAK